VDSIYLILTVDPEGEEWLILVSVSLAELFTSSSFAHWGLKMETDVGVKFL
jgi:hypothetical protein